MALAIFDLDETLIAGDSCSLFCEYLLEKGIVDQSFVERDAELMRLYTQGQLDQHDYIEFFIGELKHLSIEQIHALMPVFIESYIKPVIYPQAVSLLKALTEQNLRLLIISATSSFIVEKVAELLNVNDFIAIELEVSGSYYTGKIQGTPSFGKGKVTRLKSWLEEQEESLEGASFFSDSINDRPLLEVVSFPVATNPDQALTQLARQNSWPVLQWHLKEEGLR
ncbi:MULTISPECIES: HAD family phosphatase [unclassified Neptuniibacter]|jgi:HAD superfamily hydrolase (TIGR01490 family)|uniref:HAD family hydrolase n=1 Tax=unclassified Neptuniibacter TaxID=2630693 RepID=UPI0026E47697|nr:MULTISPECIES: HAD family hydrolase [unclassified Neptuniibacter]MDO6513564.1 HAD family hydrolase [Neptuniibacter sp. 2_MG-2023]MDO6593710.1 HAD family hydrolase [Neptuniibacter sp. 1_MG-2023]